MSDYMIRRRRYLIPKGEIVRDYRRKDLTPSDFIFSCDWEEDDGN